MSKTPHRNKFLPSGWQVHVNTSFVSELDQKATKVADLLERGYKDRLGLYSSDTTFPILLCEDLDNVTLTSDVIARAVDIMHKRSYTVTGPSQAHAQSRSITLTVAPRVTLGKIA